MAKTLADCPVCGGRLTVTELSCRHCQTRIHSVFETCRFCRLPPEPLRFVELFLRCEGNLSRVGSELGLSYPTVRNKLAAALTALGLTDAPDEQATPAPTSAPAPLPPALPTETQAARRREILEALAQGEMGADEAADALSALFTG